MKQLSNILYVSEASAAEGASLARAVSLAESNQADLTVIDVVPAITTGVGMPQGGPDYHALQTALVRERYSSLESLVAPYKKRLGIQLNVLEGKRFIEVIRAVLRNRHDMLIKPAENPSFVARMFGSDDMQLLRNCPCPVWLTSTEEKPDYACILAAVDFDLDRPGAADQNPNQQILELSSSIALSDFAALHFVHAWNAPAERMVRSWSDNPAAASIAYVEGERSRHERAFQHVREQLKVQIGTAAYAHLAPQFHMPFGPAATVIPKMATQLQADLVVVGTLARTGIAGLLIGNTAEAILEQLQCSVLAVKPSGFVSPVKLAD